MAKIQKNPLPPPLRPEDIQNRVLVVLKVKDVQVDVKVDRDQNRRGKATFMTFWDPQIPGLDVEGKGLYLNATSQQNAVEGFGSDETDHWKDKDVPLIRVNTEYEDRTTKQKQAGVGVWVAPAKDWPALFKQWKADQKDSKAPAKKS